MCFLQLLHQAITTPILYDFYNYDGEKKEFAQLFVKFTQVRSCLSPMTWLFSLTFEIWNLKFEINDNVISSHTCFQVTLNVGDFFLSTSRIWLYLGHYFFSLAWRIPCQGEHLRRRLLINQKQTKKGSSSFHHFCSVKQLNSRMPTTQPDSWLGNSFFKHVLFIASRFCVVSSLHSFSSMNNLIQFQQGHIFSFFFSRMTRAKSELCIVNYANRNLCSWLLYLAFCIFEKSFWEALHFLCEWSKKNLSGHRSSLAANKGQNVFMTFPFSSKLSVKIGTICQRSNLVYPYQTFKSKGEREGEKWRLFRLFLNRLFDNAETCRDWLT